MYVICGTFVKCLLDNFGVGHEGMEDVESSEAVSHKGRGVKSKHQVH